MARAKALLTELASSTSDADVDGCIEGRPPGHYAYLKLVSRSDPTGFAVVSTVGSPWHMLEIRGDVYDLVISEDLDYQEVRDILERYLRAVAEYLRGRRTPSTSKWLRFPVITVETDDGPMTLRLRVREQLKRLLGLRRR